MDTYDVQSEVTDKYSLRGRIYDKIRYDILNGKYKVNEAIKETMISKDLGVSRTPVREALRQLELEELVKIIPNKGAIVTGITAKDIQDIYEIRSLVEGLSAKWAAKYASEAQIAEIEEVVTLAEFYSSRNNFENLYELDSKFHQLLFEASDSRMLKHILLDFHSYVQRVRKASISTTGRAEHSLDEHRAILEAIKNRDSLKAEQLTNKHVRNTKKNVMMRKLEETETASE